MKARNILWSIKKSKLISEGGRYPSVTPEILKATSLGPSTKEITAKLLEVEGISHKKIKMEEIPSRKGIFIEIDVAGMDRNCIDVSIQPFSRTITVKTKDNGKTILCSLGGISSGLTPFCAVFLFGRKYELSEYKIIVSYRHGLLMIFVPYKV